MAKENNTDGTQQKYVYAPTFSLRLTLEERARLNADAGPLPLGAYVRSCLFDNPTTRKRIFRRPVQDEQALSQVLAALGQARLSSNLNQLAKAVHSGSLPVTPETEQALLEACSTIRAMSEQLVQALGLPGNNITPPDKGA